MTAPLVIAFWSNAPTAEGTVRVLPDGCQDLIAYIAPDGVIAWQVSPLMGRPEPVAVRPGEYWLGFRLRPGLVVDHEKVAAAAARLAARAAEEPASAVFEFLCQSAGDFEGLLVERVIASRPVDDALLVLAQSLSVGHAARALGVSERTLERAVVAHTKRTPVFWRRLARVRQASQALAKYESMAELSVDYGYSDQAHMTREMVHWIGATPRQLKRSPELLEVVRQPGYA